MASLSEVLESDEMIAAQFHPTLGQRANGFTKVLAPQDWALTLGQMCLHAAAAVGLQD